MVMRLKLVLMVSCLLVVSMAYAQQGEFDEVLKKNLWLEENYSGTCTSLNGVEFTSMLKPEVSVQEIIDSTGDSGVVSIPSGYYYLDEPLQITKSLTAIGEGVVVVDAHRSYKVLDINNSQADIKLENINFVNGKGDYGGAIYSRAKSLSLMNCAFSSNIAYYCAGVYQTEGSLLVESSTFDHNYAASRGGAVYYNTSFDENTATRDANDGLSPLIIRDTGFYGNKAGEVGTAIYSDSRGLCLESSTFSKNNGTSPILATDGRVLVRNCNISNNLGPFGGQWGGAGGGLNCVNSTVHIENSTIRYNKARVFHRDAHSYRAGGRGAGVYLLDSDTIINDTIIENNEAVLGGGICAYGSKLVINGGVINKNIARTAGSINGTGGAIYGDTQVTLNGVKLEDNHADVEGGAISNVIGNLFLDENTILTRNTATKGAAIYNYIDGNVELRCMLTNNQATEAGGAVYNKGNLSLYGATISGNNATYGSAIYNERNLTLVGGKIEDNRAIIGGSIWNSNRMAMIGVNLRE
jgi:hypothetical protein